MIGFPYGSDPSSPTARPTRSTHPTMRSAAPAPLQEVFPMPAIILDPWRVSVEARSSSRAVLRTVMQGPAVSGRRMRRHCARNADVPSR